MLARWSRKPYVKKAKFALAILLSTESETMEKEQGLRCARPFDRSTASDFRVILIRVRPCWILYLEPQGSVWF